MKVVSNLYIYPIKSLGGIEVKEANVTSRGLEFDRRWMLVDERNEFLTQRTFPKMSLLRTAIRGNELVVYVLGDEGDSISTALRPASGNEITVTVWDDVCMAWQLNAELDQWFSRKLDRSVKLVYMPEHSLRQVDQRYATSEEDVTSFSDAYPILIIGQRSLDDLNQRLEQPVPMQRFRPNIVFSGGEPYEEDVMKRFTINGLEFFGVKPCARCVMTTVDQDRGIAGKEPLATLSQYRTVDHKVMFGMNVIAGGAGIIRVADPILIP